MLLAMVALASFQQATPGTGPRSYWQQSVAYEIDASLDEPKGVLWPPPNPKADCR